MRNLLSVLIAVSMFCCFVIVKPVCIYAQEDTLQLANNYYDKDMYKEAKDNYYKVIETGSINGEILYRYAYSTENIQGLNEDTLKLYAAAYSYFSRNNQTDHKYYTSAKKKLESNKAGLLAISNEEADVIVKNISGKTSEAVAVQQDNAVKTNTSPLGILTTNLSQPDAIVVLAILALAILITGHILSSATNCVVIWGVKDLAAVSIAGIIVVIYLLGLKNDKAGSADVWLNILFFAALIATAVFSVLSNIRNILPKNIIYIVISVLTKLVIFILIPIIIAAAFYANSWGKKDRRYRDGTVNNQRTAALGIVALIAAFLIGKLIKREGADS